MPLSKDIDSMFNNALFGATLHTWGTKSRSSNGMINFLDYQFFGGDVGHASISMKLPINDTSRQWIETYCCRQTYQEFVSGAKKTTTYEEFLDKVEKRIHEIKKLLREGANEKDFDKLGILLHGYAALQKVLRKVK